MEEDNISWGEWFEEERLKGINFEFDLAAEEDRRFRIPNADYLNIKNLNKNFCGLKIPDMEFLKPRNIDELNELFDKASFEKFY